MVDITVTLSNVDGNDVDNIVNSCEALGSDVEIIIIEPWPRLTLGDRFVYTSTEYAFLAYISKYAIRAITVNTLVNDSVIQPVYFDTTKREAHMKFIMRDE